MFQCISSILCLGGFGVFHGFCTHWNFLFHFSHIAAIVTFYFIHFGTFFGTLYFVHCGTILCVTICCPYYFNFEYFVCFGGHWYNLLHLAVWNIAIYLCILVCFGLLWSFLAFCIEHFGILWNILQRFLKFMHFNIYLFGTFAHFGTNKSVWSHFTQLALYPHFMVFIWSNLNISRILETAGLSFKWGSSDTL